MTIGETIRKNYDKTYWLMAEILKNRVVEKNKKNFSEEQRIFGRWWRGDTPPHSTLCIIIQYASFSLFALKKYAKSLELSKKLLYARTYCNPRTYFIDFQVVTICASSAHYLKIVLCRLKY